MILGSDLDNVRTKRANAVFGEFGSDVWQWFAHMRRKLSQQVAKYIVAPKDAVADELMRCA